MKPHVRSYFAANRAIAAFLSGTVLVALLAGCLSMARDATLELTGKQARAVSHAVWMFDGDCGRVERIDRCPAIYRRADIEGRCVLAFVEGVQATDKDARFFTVYVREGKAEVAGYFAGGSDPDPLMITSSCGHY
jgi:hypothetical protein